MLIIFGTDESISNEQYDYQGEGDKKETDVALDAGVVFLRVHIFDYALKGVLFGTEVPEFVVVVAALALHFVEFFPVAGRIEMPDVGNFFCRAAYAPGCGDAEHHPYGDYRYCSENYC